MTKLKNMTSNEIISKISKIYGETNSLEGTYDLFLELKHRLEHLEQLEKDHDKTLINNGELVVKVTDLQKENQELVVNKNAAQILALNLKRENDKLKKAIEILKRFDFDIYAGKCLGFIQTSLEDPLTFDLEDFIEFQEYELLKEVLESE